MTRKDFIIKRGFDLVVAGLALAILWPVIGIAIVLAARDTKASGLFWQQRVGKDGRLFNVYKVRTMRMNAGSTVTVRGDSRITPLGAKLRKLKIDELPQLWNILKGEMSLVGPRPDVPGYVDTLKGKARELLKLRPGITGPATLKYRDEEAILAEVPDPQRFNDDVIWPDKVRINLEYMQHYSLAKDIRYLLATVNLADHGVS